MMVVLKAFCMSSICFLYLQKWHLLSYGVVVVGGEAVGQLTSVC